MNGYEFKAAADGKAVLYVYESIGEDFFGEGLTAKTFADDLKKIGNVKELNIRINSIGGNVFEARAMASLLKDHKAKKIVDIDGICASAATYIACTGHTVRIAADGMYMVHPPAGFVMGTATDMRKTASILDTVQAGMVEIYSKRTGKDADAIAAMIHEETWMTAEQTVENGFADSIAEPMKLAAKADLSKYPNHKLPFTIPDAVKDKVILLDKPETPILDALKERVARMNVKLEMAAVR